MLKLLNFDKILQQASTKYLALPESRQKQLKESLDNGKAILRNENQMNAYLHHYGEIHRHKLLRAYRNLPPSLFNGNFSVIDWGCGQGLASIVLDEFIEREKGLSRAITDITLIEPSNICLRRAIANINWSLPKGLLSYLNKKEEAVLPEDLCMQENKILHVLSNVIDLPEFTGEGIKKYLSQSCKSRHIIVMVSPFYPEDGRGKRMDEFCNSLKGFRKIYSFQKHIGEWEEDYSCQIRILDNW